MKRLLLLPLLCLPLLLSGCLRSSFTQAVKAAVNGHLTLVHKISTVYGTYYGVVIPDTTNGMTTTVSPDGTVTVTSPKAPVPITK